MIEIKQKTLENLKFIDLFAGLGGFRLALESFGANCVFSSDWDKHAQDVYESNFGDRPEGDITKIKEKDIPMHDILCAGFPCQAFSISGKQRGFEDSRGTLFFDVARIARFHQPKVVFLENVKNFASHDNGNTLRIVVSTMESIGYKVYYKVLNALDYGIPQKRERIYIVCFRKDIDSSFFCFPKPFKLTRFVKDFLDKDSPDIEKMYSYRSDIILQRDEPSSPQNTTIRLGIVNKGGQGERIYSTQGIAITLSAYGGGYFAKTGGYLINGKPRRLTTRECARIMGFPDSYKIAQSKNQAYKQFGNSVIVDVLQYITQNISDTLNGIFKLT